MPNQYGPRKHELTAERRAILLSDYHSAPGQINHFAQRFGVSRWYIVAWVKELGLNRPPGERWMYELTEERRAILLAEYRGRSGQINAFAERFGVTPWIVRLWVKKLGLRQADRPWTADEDRYLTQWLTRKTYSEMAVTLSRSVHSLRDRASRLGVSKRDFGYTLSQVAEGFGVAHSTARAWVQKGWLKGRRIKTDRDEEHGDFYCFKDQDIVRFVRAHVQAVDPHKFDWLWLADVLFGGYHGIGELGNPEDEQVG